MGKRKKRSRLVVVEEEEEVEKVGKGGYLAVKEGAKIEVWDERKGFEGAWFPGTVLALPPRVPKVNVVYDHMLASDGSGNRLVESVKLTHMRPPPPPHHGGAFQLHDVVDAFHCDVWWIGLIVEVHQDNNSFTGEFVTTKERFDFKPSSLRLHFDWVDDAWVRPPKQCMILKEDGSTSDSTSEDSSPGDLGFEKKSPVWKVIESMEVFVKYPQKPHFRPLLEVESEEREGLAIGQMVIFGHMMDKVNLDKTHSREAVQRMVQSLAGFEEMGFDVQPARDRLTHCLNTNCSL